MTALMPIKTSLVADLVDVINENIGALLRPVVKCCPICDGRGTVGGEVQRIEGKTTIHDDGTLMTCPTCSGVGATEQYELDMDAIRSPRIGRLVEGFEFKGGQLVPKFRSKDKAFAALTKLLGYDKAIVEIANGAAFSQTLSDEQKSAYVDQLKELAAMGLLDGAK
jgi:hypothetical protein